MRTQGSIAILVLCVSATVPSIVRAQTNTALKALADEYWDARMEHYPMTATAIGDYRYNDRLNDLSMEAAARWMKTLDRLHVQIRSMEWKGLSDDDQLTRDLLARVLEDGLLRYASLHRYYLPLEPLNGPHIRFPLILISQPFRNVEDFKAYTARLKAFPKQIDDMIANIRKGMALGIVAPRAVVTKVLPQIQTHIVEDVTTSEFYKPVAKASALSESDRASVVAAITKAIQVDVVPAYKKLQAFVQKEYIPACRATVGISEVPLGRQMYEDLAYLNMTIRISPDEIHKIGLSEVARIREEMSKVQQEIGFEGSLAEFLTHMRTDPRYRFDSARELVRNAAFLLKRTKLRMPELFGNIPKADCVMKEIEPFRAVSSPVAYYNPPPEDGSRPAYYYINTHEPGERLRFTLEALTYHEAVPGHHLQIALDRERTSLPRFRRYASFTAYVEGWALYAEKLGYDLDLYRTPEAKFGQLTFEMWRACRLVVDTGMHAKGWSRERAIDFLTENTVLAPLDISAEVDRYISWPGQALAYKVGELRILRLRELAEKRLGAKFDLRAFHDALLGGGAMPIDTLQKRMRAWIDEHAGP